ncbi:hypothetical protein Bca4012_064887 [Brassica carinata]
MDIARDVGSSSASTKYSSVQKLESVAVAELNAYVLNSESHLQPQLFSFIIINDST